MQHLILISSALLFLASQSQFPEKSGPPVISFESTAKDFGKVAKGIHLRHIFTFSNDGQSMLRILSLKPGCACTAALLSEKQIDPKQKGQIEVTVNTRGLRYLKRNVIVETNDPLHPIVTLIVQATVESAFFLSEQFIYFDTIRNNPPVTKELLLIFTSDIKLLNVRSTDPTLTAKLVPVEGNDQKRFKLILVQQPRAAKGYYFGKITIEISGLPVSQIVIPFRGIS